MIDVRKSQAVAAQSFLEPGNTGGRAAVVEGKAFRGLEEVAGDDALGAAVMEVDRLDAPILAASRSR
jgi:hypothetical protein